VNSGNVLQTQFTYDPFGSPTTTGTASQYPYLFRGMEYDATGLYNAGGVYYSPNLGRPLQQVTPGGPGGGQGGINVSTPSFQGSSGGLGPANYGVNAGVTAAAGALAGFIGGSSISLADGFFISVGFSGGFAIPVLAVVATILGILDLFGFDLFGGGGSAPVIPPGYYRHPHYVPAELAAVPRAIAPNMEDSHKQEDPLHLGHIPLLNRPMWGYKYCGPGNYLGKPNGTTDRCCQAHDNCYAAHGLSSRNVKAGHPGSTGPAQAACDQNLCDCVEETNPSGRPTTSSNKA